MKDYGRSTFSGRGTTGRISSENRLTPSEIADVYKFIKILDRPIPELIAIVDDVLTTGAHYKAMKDILVIQYPKAKVIGLFLTRREIPSSNKQEFFL